MNVLTAIVGVLIMGLGGLTVIGMFVAGAVSIVIVAREKNREKKAKAAEEANQ